MKQKYTIKLLLISNPVWNMIRCPYQMLLPFQVAFNFRYVNGYITELRYMVPGVAIVNGTHHVVSLWIQHFFKIINI